MADPVRSPAVAGHFYPADADALAQSIDSSLVGVTRSAVDPVAVIAPHAGYRWSGSVAAAAHLALAGRATPIERVVVAGPTHEVAVRGVGLTSATAFATPFGEMSVDTDAVSELHAVEGVVAADESHEREYSIEVQLPFIQRLLGDVAVVPLAVGSATPGWLTADVLERLTRDDRTAVVVSSDLSHHHGADRAHQIDGSTTRHVEQLDVDAIGGDRMCGAAAVKGLLTLARRRHLDVRTLDVRNSGDFGADPERVVGYGAYSFVDPGWHPVGADERDALLGIARGAAHYRLAGGRPSAVDTDGLPARLSVRGAAFVSATVGGDLRGCVGSVEAVQPLGEAVARLAGGAVRDDNRFPAVSPDEIDELSVDVNVLSPLERVFVGSLEELVGLLTPGEDGLVIMERGRRATYLPSVWRNVDSAEAFVAGVLTKGSFAGSWTPDRAVYRYSSQELG